MVKQITEEMGVHEVWYKDAKDTTPETLGAFVQTLVSQYDHDYGTIVHAAAASAAAAAHAVNNSPTGGITGFQAGCVMWEFIKHWMTFEGPMTLLRYENMLFPQYADHFDKTISGSTWEWLQDEARKRLNEGDHTYTSPNVLAHWKSITEGVVPFGYRVVY